MLLNQVIALVKGEKNRAEDAFTKSFRDTQKTEPLAGITKTYEPKDEDGDLYPSQKNLPQLNAETLLTDVTTALSRLFDLTATLEYGNTSAKADIVVDGRTILAAVPVTYLLFLEKKLVDLNTFVSKLPTLDPSVVWEFDGNTSSFRSEPVVTTKQKKVKKVLTLAPATDKHPAQVQTYDEDVLEGYWTTTKFSGSLPVERVRELTSRVRKLQDAVKSAREQANSSVITEVQYADSIFGYLFN